MPFFRSNLLSAILVFSFALNGLLFSACSYADEGDYEQYDDQPAILEIAADIFLVRPLSLAVTGAGAVVWVVALPMALLGGNPGELGELLVLEPGRFTFVRPVGYMELDTPTAWEKKYSN